MTDKTMNVVIWVVTGIWASNVLVGMGASALGRDYPAPDGINAIFTVVMGGAFAARAAVRGKNGNDNNGGGDT